MKLKEGIKILKGKYPEYIILVKNGLFYNAIGEDAIILSKEFNLVKICFGNEICKIGINEYKIKEFLAQLIQENYKYIVYNYSKGDFKDIEEQFIEIERKDNGKQLEKENIKVDCLSCNYYKRKKQREKIEIPVKRTYEIYHEAQKTIKNKKDFIKIFNKKKELEKEIQNISKITNDYLNNLIDEYLMGEEDEYKKVMYETLENIYYLQKIHLSKWLYYLNKIDAELNIQRSFLRIMYKNRWIDCKKFNIAIGLISEIGKIIGGLIKYYAQNNKKSI